MAEMPSQRRVLWVLAVAVPYFAWFGGMVGLRFEHIGLFLLCSVFFMGNLSMRKALAGSAAFVVFWVIYDSLRVWPNYTVNPVNIIEPYAIDKAWFGVETSEGRLTMPEYFSTRTTAFWDVITAMFYLTWVPVPFIFALWLWRNDRKLFVRFSYGYLFTNIVGFSLYYIYPAAPPWYVELYGFEFDSNVGRSAAGLNNFDKLIGFDLFKTIYSRNSNVFAAVPSLHSAYPLISFLYARELKTKFWQRLFFVLCLGIWCSAIYLRHHYVIDVVLGMLTAVVAYFIFEFLVEKTPLGKWFGRLLNYIQ